MSKEAEEKPMEQKDFDWLGFWSLLLEIDKRNSPERYKKPLKETDD